MPIFLTWEPSANRLLHPPPLFTPSASSHTEGSDHSEQCDLTKRRALSTPPSKCIHSILHTALASKHDSTSAGVCVVQRPTSGAQEPYRSTLFKTVRTPKTLKERRTSFEPRDGRNRLATFPLVSSSVEAPAHGAFTSGPGCGGQSAGAVWGGRLGRIW